MHITSLPSPYGIGDFGPGAYKFVEFLKESNQKVWQVLPLNPTSSLSGNSPYSGDSAFAGNSLFISPEILVQDGYLQKRDIATWESFPEESVDFQRVIKYKNQLLTKAYDKFSKSQDISGEFEQFCTEESYWLDDYAMYVVIKNAYRGKAWGDWDAELRDRDKKMLKKLGNHVILRIKKQKFLQYQFFKQWKALKSYANENDIALFGDMPIYVDYDSADVWTNSDIFKLDKKKKPVSVAGVPPDYFSKTGQLWGNPIFNWKQLMHSDCHWWIQRFGHNLKLFDLLRIDHFRGLVSYWEVPASDNTAINGKWVKAPVKDFLNKVIHHYPELPIIAEDLGLITPDVRRVMEEYGIPGMKVLLFAFFDSMQDNPYIPHNHIQDCVVYTGTHDNNTVRGWFENEADTEIQRKVYEYIGHFVGINDVSWEFIRLAMMSVSKLIIIPMQDILSLGEEARMNRPATCSGNWKWRLVPNQVNPELISRLKETTSLYGRIPDRQDKNKTKSREKDTK